MYLSGLLDGLFGSEMRLLRLMGRTLAASKVRSLFGIILSPIFHAKMTIRRPWGAPWEAHGVPFGDPRACPKPLFYQNGDHEQTLVYTAFAPLYELQGAAILAPKTTTVVKSEHSSLEKCRAGHNEARVYEK